MNPDDNNINPMPDGNISPAAPQDIPPAPVDQPATDLDAISNEIAANPEAAVTSDTSSLTSDSPSVSPTAPSAIDQPLNPVAPTPGDATVSTPDMASVSSVAPASEMPPVPDMAAAPTEQPIGAVPNTVSEAIVAGSIEPAPVADGTMTVEPATPATPNLEPAAPVPGSIGSASSYSDTLNNLNNPAPATAKKPLNIKLIAIIAGAAVVLVVLIILLIGILSGNKTDNSKDTAKENTNPPVESTLVCARIGTAEYLANLSNAKEAENMMTAEFKDDELVSIETELTAVYPTNPTAMTALSTIRDSYEKSLKTLGLSEDTIESSFKRTDSTITIKHTAYADNLDSNAAAVIGLPVDAEGGPDTAIDSIEAFYKKDSYTCERE